MQRQLFRPAIGLVLLAALGFAALFGFALYEKWGNPSLQKTREPKLEAATTENTDQVKGLVASDDPVNPQESDGALTLRGEVVLPDGKPAAGATVSCWQTASGAEPKVSGTENISVPDTNGTAAWDERSCVIRCQCFH